MLKNKDLWRDRSVDIIAFLSRLARRKQKTSRGETMTNRTLLRYAAVLLALGACQDVPIQAQAAPNFYAGKTVSLVIGSAAGGIFDFGGRLMARYLQKHIPGNPTVVPRNMPGASSVIATEYIYNVAPNDGLTLASIQPTIVLDKILDPKLKYQSEKFSWIGRIQPLVFAGLSWRASGVKTIKDARERTVIVSAQGASGISAIVPWALNKLAGTHFRVITGYESQGPAFIAMERGEVQGIGSAALTDALAKKDWSANHSVSVLYTITEKRSALAPDSPSIVELADNDDDRKALTLLGRGMDVGQTLMAPPGVPSDRTTLLRKAFGDMIIDPNFIKDAKQLGISVDPLDGMELSDLVVSASEAPLSVLKTLRLATRPQ